MPTMNISLPENLKDFVESQVQSGDYSSVSEFMRDLVRREQKNRQREALELQLLQGLNSGESIDSTPEMWDSLRERLRRRKNATTQT
ncbi:MAG: type II toxin-antitoxin system ParD family antitoxin [Terracidiphilus sp.]